MTLVKMSSRTTEGTWGREGWGCYGPSFDNVFPSSDDGDVTSPEEDRPEGDGLR